MKTLCDIQAEIKTNIYGSYAHTVLLAYAYKRERPAYLQSWTLASWSLNRRKNLCVALQFQLAEWDGVDLGSVGKEERKASFDKLLEWLSVPPSDAWTAKRKAAEAKAAVVRAERREQYRLVRGG